METLHTFRRKTFQYDGLQDGSFRIYTGKGLHKGSKRPTLMIKPEIIDLVKREIAARRRVMMGASRDNPPPLSLGAMLLDMGQTPQLLSYLIPILAQQGYCRTTNQDRACLVVYLTN